MKFIITIIVTLGLAIGFTLLAMQDPGYVVLARDPYALRIPLALFTLFLLVAFAALYLLFNFIAAAVRAPENLRKWRLRRIQKRAQVHTMQGYARLITGEWSRAEKELRAQLPYNLAPLLNYLGAAYAAQQQKNLPARDEYLAEVAAKYPAQWQAIGLAKARLHYQAGELAAARTELEKLAKRAPKNIAVARLRAEVYQQLQDWPAAVDLLPSLKKLKAFAADELARREQLVYENYLAAPDAALPSAMQQDHRALASYARKLLREGAQIRAENILRRALNRSWQPLLANLYGQVETTFTADQIKLAESWVKKYGAHVELTLCLARLHRRARNWPQAREYYFAVVATDGRVEARAELGALLERMGEAEAALVCYRQGMAAVVPDADALPAVTVDGGGDNETAAAMPMLR